MTVIRIITPTFKPVGGVIKLFDYVLHSRAAGLEPVVYAPNANAEDRSVLSIEHFQPLADGAIRFEHLRALRVDEGDLALFSWPTHYELIAKRADPLVPPEHVIHLVQGIRHANPTWLEGYAARLLSRPLTRIMVTEQIRDACERLVHPTSLSTTIVEGHNWPFFERVRDELIGRPVRVGYTTWKSDVARRVEDSLRADTTFEFRHIAGPSGWTELRDLYHWCDVFIAAPGPEEGFYLPGLEAMAAGAIVVIPDVGGNMEYCDPDANCLLVRYDDVDSYVTALHRVASMGEDAIRQMRDRARSTLSDHTLGREQADFQVLVKSLTDETE